MFWITPENVVMADVSLIVSVLLPLPTSVALSITPAAEPDRLLTVWLKPLRSNVALTITSPLPVPDGIELLAPSRKVPPVAAEIVVLPA